MQYNIIGSGILGLCVAEYFSRKNAKIILISNNNSFSGSYAASANLATKGQVFARDSHFQLKLNSKKNYKSWLQSLLNELQKDELHYFNSNFQFESLFLCGKGIDVFENMQDRDKQLKRVVQNKEELIQKNCPFHSIQAKETNFIEYENESWVNAPILLKLLTFVLKKRGVEFIENTVDKTYFDNLQIKNPEIMTIFCTGAWTKSLLNSLEIPLPNALKKSERLSIGTTFTSQIKCENTFTPYVLVEKIDHNFSHKYTLSGFNKTDVSSTSIKLNWTKYTLNNNEEWRDKLNKKNTEFLNNFEKKENIHIPIVEKTGFRVGYGHSEIVVEPIFNINDKLIGYICCGAHKSGFLFGPVVGKLINDLILSSASLS